MPPSGMSVNLAVTYLLATKLGEEVTVDARVVKSGRNLATIQVCDPEGTENESAVLPLPHRIPCPSLTFQHLV